MVVVVVLFFSRSSFRLREALRQTMQMDFSCFIKIFFFVIIFVLLFGFCWNIGDVRHLNRAMINEWWIWLDWRLKRKYMPTHYIHLYFDFLFSFEVQIKRTFVGYRYLLFKLSKYDFLSFSFLTNEMNGIKWKKWTTTTTEHYRSKTFTFWHRCSLWHCSMFN